MFVEQDVQDWTGQRPFLLPRQECKAVACRWRDNGCFWGHSAGRNRYTKSATVGGMEHNSFLKKKIVVVVVRKVKSVSRVEQNFSRNSKSKILEFNKRLYKERSRAGKG